MNLQELAQDIYNTNKENGFWDKERNREECMALINSELYEALEAHRKGKFSNVDEYKWLEKRAPYFANQTETDHFQQAFITNIKDTVEDELSDAIIRTLDFIFGFVEIGISERLKEKTSFKQCVEFSKYKIPSNFGAFILYGSGFICVDAFNWPLRIIGYISKYCEQKNIDLDFHVREKLRFNKTRERMHGKKY